MSWADMLASSLKPQTENSHEKCILKSGKPIPAGRPNDERVADEGLAYYMPPKECGHSSQNDPQYKHKGVEAPGMTGQNDRNSSLHSGNLMYSAITDADMTSHQQASSNSTHNKLEEISQIPMTTTQSGGTSYHSTATELSPIIAAHPQVKPRLVYRMTHIPVFVKGNFPPAPIKDSISGMHYDVIKTLEADGWNYPKTQQQQMWPAVLSGQNVVSVAGVSNGKTLGFLAPLASELLYFKSYSNINKGPLVLILCSNAANVLTAERWMNKFTYMSRHFINIVANFEGCTEYQKQSLINGCHVLITTPPCLIRILDSFGKDNNFDRLCHLVFDDADVLFEHFIENVHIILDKCQKSFDHVECRKQRPLQVIVTSCKWTRQVEDFVKHIVDPIVIVSSGFEVFAYCKLPPMVHVLPETYPYFRAQQVLETVRKHCGITKTVVMCECKEEAVYIHEFLRSQCVTNLWIAHEKMTMAETMYVSDSWWSSSHQAGNLPLLIATDDALPNVGVFDAYVLVNFRLPANKVVFNARLNTVIYAYLRKSNDVKAASPEVHILLDKNDSIQVPAIVELLTRMKVEISEGLEEKAKEILKIQAGINSDAPLCANLRNFGTCSLRSCSFRHVVVAAHDTSPPQVPLVGEVQFKVMHIHSATHYSAHLEKHTSLDGVSTSFLREEHVLLPIEMSKHFANPQNRKLLDSNIAIGTICALQVKLNLFQRVRVEILKNRDKQGIPRTSIIKSIDEGWTREIMTHQLYYLPEKLTQPVPQAVDIHLCRLKPRDLEPQWSPVIGEMVSKWLQETVKNGNDKYYLYGKIVLSMGGSLWIDPLECCQYSASSAICFSFHSRLLKCDLVIENPSHMTKLYELCKQGGLELPDYNQVEAVKKETSPVEETSLALKKHQDPYGSNLETGTDPDISASDIAASLDILQVEATKKQMLQNSLEFKSSKLSNLEEESLAESSVAINAEKEHAADCTVERKKFHLFRFLTESNCHMPLQYLMNVHYESLVQWSQNEEWVTIKVQLPVVNDYDLDIESRRVKFLTKTSGSVYFFDITLFDHVIPHQCKHSAKGQPIEIWLHKLEPFQWLQLERKKKIPCRGKPKLEEQKNEIPSRGKTKLEEQKNEIPSRGKPKLEEQRNEIPSRGKPKLEEQKNDIPSKGKNMLDVDVRANQCTDLMKDNETDVKIREGWDIPSRAGTEGIPTDPNLSIPHKTYDESSKNNLCSIL